MLPEIVHVFDYKAHLLFSHHRTERQTKHVRMDAFGDGQREVVPLPVGPLFVRRNGIMDKRLDAVGSQMALQIIAARMRYHEEMPNMTCVVGNVLRIPVWLPGQNNAIAINLVTIA